MSLLLLFKGAGEPPEPEPIPASIGGRWMLTGKPIEFEPVFLPQDDEEVALIAGMILMEIDR